MPELHALPRRLLHKLHHRSWMLSYVPPPYEEEKLFRDVRRGRPERYSLLILDGPFDGDARDDLQRAIQHLRSAFAMPCFVRFDSVDNTITEGLRAAVIAAGGEILFAADSIEERARYLLTQRRDFASDWTSWLQLRRELGWRQEAVIRTLVNPPNGSRSSMDSMDTLHAAEISPRSARRWLNSANLPAPSAWFCAARILRGLLRLQRDPNLHVAELAVQLGYSGADALSNQMFRYFGHGARKGRSRLGLEPRFHAFETPAAARRS